MPDKQNEVILTRNNPVAVRCVWVVPAGDDPDDYVTSWSDFTDIHVEAGDTTYTLVANPSVVVVKSDTLLHVLLGNVAPALEVGAQSFTVTGFSATYPEGYEVISKERTPEMGPIKVAEPG